MERCTRCCPHRGVWDDASRSYRFRCCHCLNVIPQGGRAPPRAQTQHEPTIKAPRPREYFISDAVIDAARETDERKHLANRLRPR